MVHTVTLDSRK